jgi:tetratricopeptide (TPR) repeat protein
MDDVSHENPANLPHSQTAGSRSTASQRRWLVIAGALLVIFGSAAFLLPPEIARWYAAAAEEAALDRDYDRAVHRMSQALWWHPDDAQLLVRRAELRRKTNDLEGSLADCNQAWEHAVGGDRVTVLEQRMTVLQRLGRHADALADADRIVEIVENAPNRAIDRGNGQIVTLPLALNNRAYAHALAERDLERGLADIERAFALLGSEGDAALLDTRGYLHYLLGNVDAALSDMERSVQLAEADQLNFQAIRTAQWQRGVDPRFLEEQGELLDQSLAVHYHHRGLVYQQLGREAEAEKDFTRAEQLGYDPAAGVW